jgi:Ser/Thr protein kinase RdoA (MazF antagonist)
VQYRLELRGEDGAPLVRLAHARLYAGGRAERIWSRGSTQALAETVEPDRAVRACAYVAGLGAVVQSYPLDVELPALTRLRSLAMVRYKPARKALLRDDSRYVKVYADDRGARAFAAGRALYAAGAPVVEPLGYRSRLRLLVHPAVGGQPLAALRGPAYDRAAGAAGQALARLHATPLQPLPQHTWRADLSAAAWAVGTACPKLRRAGARLADRIADALADGSSKAVTSHGDFYDDQLLVSDQGVLVLDLDRAVTTDPVLDLGTFLAHLRTGREDGRAREEFLSHYGRLPSGRLLAVAEAAALLKLAVAPFRALEADWPGEVERRVRLAERQLAEAAPVIRPGWDDALPQLDELLDGASAGRLLTRLHRKRVEVLGAEVVRHRPGRRCTLRYELSIGGCREEAYAKTYASARAPRVHAALVEIAAAGERAGAFSVPEPVGCVSSLHLVVQRAVSGEPVTRRLLVGDVGLAGEIAAALHALHTSGAELPSSHAADDELRIVASRLVELPPSLHRAARESLERAADALERFRWRRRPVHRDLYHDQILVDGDRLVFLDLDDAAMSEPAVDVANLVGHLRLLAFDAPRSAEPLQAAAAFESRYASLDAALDLRLVRTLEAATLLRLGCIHLRRGGVRLAERLIDASEALLAEAA